MKSRISGILLAVVVAGLAGCTKQVKKTDVGAEDAAAQAAAKAAGEMEQAPIELGKDWAAVPQLTAVYFDTNLADLRDDARAALKRNAAVLKAILAEAPSAQIRVEGYGDERNTLEYNLALGQRRANALKTYYAALGVKKSALSTISYGEERPVCTESNEGCWWRNRRGETTVRSASGPIRIPRQKLSSVLP
jgi:peptidoglycan-associated lipoprotein